jgi:hypothetical protein
VALWSTQPVTEMSTGNISWGVKVVGALTDKLTIFMCQLSWNLGAWTSSNPQGLSRSVMGLLFSCCPLIEYQITYNRFGNYTSAKILLFFSVPSMIVFCSVPTIRLILRQVGLMCLARGLVGGWKVELL